MLHQADKDLYWQGVERALDLLDEASRAEAARRLRREVEALPSDARELFYHAEPLDVAKDLAGLRECSEEQMREYLEKVQRVVLAEPQRTAR